MAAGVGPAAVDEGAPVHHQQLGRGRGRGRRRGGGRGTLRRLHQSTGGLQAAGGLVDVTPKVNAVMGPGRGNNSPMGRRNDRIKPCKCLLGSSIPGSISLPRILLCAIIIPAIIRSLRHVLIWIADTHATRNWSILRNLIQYNQPDLLHRRVLLLVGVALPLDAGLALLQRDQG